MLRGATSQQKGARNKRRSYAGVIQPEAAAHILQVEGVIQYRWGHITIVDRKLMEDRSHEGYAILKEDYNPCWQPTLREHARK